jgi:hypothetical protein
MVAITENANVDEELRKAYAARAHSPILPDTTLGHFLEELHKEAFRLNALQQREGNYHLESLPPAERAAQASQIGRDKLHLVNRIEELAEKFQPFLRLKDL